jgi:hypothetical protein
VEVLPHAALLRSPQLSVYRRLMASGKLRRAGVDPWWTWLAEADPRGQFFTANFGFIAVAQKP